MKLTLMKRRELVQHEWRVYTTSEQIQTGIAEFLGQTQQESAIEEIFYRGEVLPVFVTPFSVAEKLADNRVRWQGHTFRIFHKEKGEKLWTEWQEERKTPFQKIARLKKAGVLKKGALMP